MKNLLKYSLLVLLASVMFTSCHDELLEPVPELAISDLSAFDTRDRVTNQVRGIYAAFRSGEYLGGRFFVYNDIRSDDFLNHQANGVTGLMTWNHGLTSSTGEVQNLWVAIYAAINRVNLFVEGLEANRSRLIGQNIITQAEFDQFKGEALALRGLAYFHLMQLYARPFNQNPAGLGAVLRLTASRSGAGNDMARSTLQQTYDQILTDLNDAEGLLPTLAAGTANSVPLVTRINENTVIALKTRVHLHMNNWPAVRTEANKIVSATAPFVSPIGVRHGLAGTFVSIFRPPYTTAESIFSMPFTAAELPGTQNSLSHYFAGSTIGGNEYSINLTSRVWTSTAFPATDTRRTLVTTVVMAGVDRIFLAKYSVPNIDWAPVIRYAEVLLNLAEAEAMIAWPSTRAVDLLNSVFLRSNPGGTALLVTDFATRDAFIDRLLLERNLEFMGEGIRNMDTKRRLLPHLGKPGATGSVPHTALNYVWPIPDNERVVNQLIQPN